MSLSDVSLCVLVLLCFIHDEELQVCVHILMCFLDHLDESFVYGGHSPENWSKL